MSATITTLPVPSGPLPTPPFSPSSVTHSSHLLEALITHYQRERMWVKQTMDVISEARARHLSVDAPMGSSESDAGIKPRPLWMRRKSRRILRLSDLAHSKLSQRLLMHDAYGTRVLELFGDLLDSRIESCKRVEALVTQSARRRRLLPMT